MKQALLNRLSIINLKITLYSRLKILVWSCILPILKICNLSVPAFDIKFNGYNIYIKDGTDLGTFLEVFLHNEYKISDLNFPVLRILDLGANSGYTSIYFADRFKNAQIVAVEADPDNVKKLKINIAAYNGRITVEPSAVASKSGSVDFFRNFKTSISGSTISRDNNAEKVSVPALTIADLEVKYGKFDLIKFDIEGGEWDVLYPNMLVHQPQIWIGEYHEDLTKRPVADFINRFDQYNVNVRQIARKRYSLIFIKKSS
jgi:FkbM family methyltransferase